jgi:hypothetical protein
LTEIVEGVESDSVRAGGSFGDFGGSLRGRAGAGGGDGAGGGTPGSFFGLGFVLAEPFDGGGLGFDRLVSIYADRFNFEALTITSATLLHRMSPQ